MKKLLLSCFLAIGIGASAQISFTQGFNSTVGVGVFGAGQAQTSGTVFCAAAPSILQPYTATNNSGGVMQIASDLGQSTTGNKIDISFSLRKTGTNTGKIQLFYALRATPGSTTWNITYLGNPTTVPTGTVGCTPITFTIPAGTLTPGGDYGFGMMYTLDSGTSSTVYYDDLIVKEEVTAIPACTAVNNIAANSTVNGGETVLSWPSVGAATSGYKVTVGTTSGGSDIYNATVPNTSNSILVTLPLNSTIYTKVIPTNPVGDATGCNEVSFTTNSTSNYCVSSATSTSYEKISNVTFAGINNNSNSTAGYENFSTVSTTVNRGSSYPISVSVSQFDADGDEVFVWIDYNKNGMFEEGEKTILNAAAVSTGNISIPTSAVLGATRMRVKLIYAATSANPCGSFNYGQVEDYTVNIDDVLGASTVNKDAVSVYPNPFKDVLKITDVKNVKSISISDVAGRKVQTLAPAAELNLSTLKSGLYIVTLHMNDGTVKSIKTIKE